MSTVQSPTILYPNGGESIASPTVTVLWTAPAIPDSSNRPVWYELFYTQDYNYDDEPNWIAIATMPSTATQFVWAIPNTIRSSKTRMGIRTRNDQGTRSEISVSAADFSVNVLILPVPNLVSPIPNSRYDNLLTVDIDNTNVPRRGFYHLYYSSASANIPQTTIANNVPASSLPFQWDISSLPAAPDYVFYAVSVDRNGNSSETATAKGIQIEHAGVFILDTTPPEASVYVNTSSIFTKNNAINVNVYTYDEATGVQAFCLEELNSDATVLSAGTPQTPRTVAAYTMSTGDGVKTISCLAQDFGGNRNLDSSGYNLLVDALRLSGGSVVDFAVLINGSSASLYVVTDGDGSNKALYQIVTYPHQLCVLPLSPTAVGVYQLDVYIATVDVDNTGHLSLYTTAGLTPIYDFTAFNEYITCMTAALGSLYMGTNTGRLLVYDGGGVTELSLPDSLIRPISDLSADNASLYVTFANTPYIYVYNGGSTIQVTT